VDFKMPQEFGKRMGPHFICGGAGVTGVEVGVL